jgi:hypothetical protein
MYDRGQIMRRAWELKRRVELGYASFGDALRDAWAEAKGELAIVEDVSPETAGPADDPDTQVTLAMGRLARLELAAVTQRRRGRSPGRAKSRTP